MNETPLQLNGANAKAGNDRLARVDFTHVRIEELLAVTTSAVESRMREVIQRAFAKRPDLLHDALALTNDSGQRLLSTLLRSSYEISGRSFEDVLEFAAGVELLQVSTLLVDDILDEAESRNGQPTIVMTKGAKEAVVVGILLSSLARKTMATAVSAQCQSEEVFKVLRLFDEVEHNVYMGQFLDLRGTGKIGLSEGEYFSIISNTTACFIRAPLVAGAILWRGPDDLISRLGAIGFNLGLAYQLRDDVIDFLGDPVFTGKPRFVDLNQRRMRLPVIHALKNLDRDNRAWLEGLLEGGSDISQEEKTQVLDLLEKSASIEYVMQKTAEYCEAANDLLIELQRDHEEFCCRVMAIARLISLFE